MANHNNADLNQLDLTPYQEQINTYILRKNVVMDKSYTVEDVLIIGLRTLDREYKWQLKHGSTAVSAKVSKMKAKLMELGIDPDEL
jgi:hypothetical protein